MLSLYKCNKIIRYVNFVFFINLIQNPKIIHEFQAIIPNDINDFYCLLTTLCKPILCFEGYNKWLTMPTAVRKV